MSDAVKGRPFYLTVDSGSPGEPDPRRFGSLEAALHAFDEMNPKWQRWTWITEARPGTTDLTHMRDGKRVDG